MVTVLSIRSRVPEIHMAFEADGLRWHRHRMTQDGERDAWLLAEYGLPVVRMTEAELMLIGKTNGNYKV